MLILQIRVIKKINKDMKLVKFMLVLSAISFAVAAILLIWSESKVTCDIITCKVFETVFVISSLVLTKEIMTMKS